MVEAQPIGSYEVPSGCCDELLEAHGAPRPHAAPLIAALQRLGPEALQAAGLRRDRIFMQQGSHSRWRAPTAGGATARGPWTSSRAS